MDFISDTLSNGVNFRSLNIIDDFNREALLITMDTSLTSKRVIRELDGLIAWRGGAPGVVQVNNGPEFIADALAQWAKERGDQYAIYSARQALSERLYGAIQPQF